ncbi:hypothetical protein HZS_6972 [Henneguya salminicola]|nr:hypothetical protein HZS_6972 [Henneguya salminicola]
MSIRRRVYKFNVLDSTNLCLSVWFNRNFFNFRDFQEMNTRYDLNTQTVIGSVWYSNLSTFMMSWILSYSLIKN